MKSTLERADQPEADDQRRSRDHLWQEAAPEGSEARARLEQFLRGLEPTVIAWLTSTNTDPCTILAIANATLEALGKDCLEDPGLLEQLETDPDFCARCIAVKARDRRKEQGRWRRRWERRNERLPDLGVVEDRLAYGAQLAVNLFIDGWAKAPTRYRDGIRRQVGVTRPDEQMDSQETAAQRPFDSLPEVQAAQARAFVSAAAGEPDAAGGEDLTLSAMEVVRAAAKECLTARQLAAFELKYVTFASEKKSQVLIARAMGIAESSVSTLLKRADERLYAYFRARGTVAEQVAAPARTPIKTDPDVLEFRREKHRREVGR